MNKQFLNAAIEGSCLFGQDTGIGIYTYTLIKHLSMIEKRDNFFVWYSSAPLSSPFLHGINPIPAFGDWIKGLDLFKKSAIDFKQHNITHRKSFLPFPSIPEIDVYHNTCYADSRKLGASKRILTIHDISPLVMPQLYDENTVALFEADMKANVASCDAIIAPSRHTKNDLIKHLKIEDRKIHVINEGAGEEFKPQQKYRADLVKTRYSIKRPYMLFVGALEERKNIKNLLKAYSKLKYESPPDLVIVGKEKNQGRDAPIGSGRLLKMTHELGIENSVKYLGYVERKALPSLMSGSEFFIWPSLYEGFGLPVLEAMSCGAAIISSNTSSIPEIAGDAGILVDPHNTEMIAQAIRGMISGKDLLWSLKEKSLEQSKKFSAKKMAVETLELYRKAAQS